MARLVLVLLLLLHGGVANSAEPTNLAGQPVAEKRVALVIGNAAYLGVPLTNPVNDAEDVAAKLRARGFEVVERKNLKTSQIGRTLREFRSKLSQGSVALVFYAGHGLQIKGENYLPTVDADIEGEEDVPNQSLSVKQLLDVLDESKTRLNLVFLDACRNNPYNRRFRSAGSGLAKETPPSGTLISFATRPGNMASDGKGRNGLYTENLLKVMDVPNQPIELALKQVVSGVKLASKGQQEPWMEGSIEGEFHFLYQARPQSNALTGASGAAQQEAINRAVEDAVKRTNEQASRERAEMQASMERILKEALARQNAQLEAERRQRDERVPPPAATPPTTASISPTPTSKSLTTGEIAGIAQGDEWEYVSRDKRFGKKDRKLVLRVKAATKDGVLEEIEWDGRRASEWVFGSKPMAVGAPNEAEFLFAPHWDGTAFKTLTVEGGSGICTSAGYRCELRIEKQGAERITVPAGTFDTIRMDGWLNIGTALARTEGEFTIWYSPETRRLVKQHTDVRAGIIRTVNFEEIIELQAIRRSNQ